MNKYIHMQYKYNTYNNTSQYRAQKQTMNQTMREERDRKIGGRTNSLLFDFQHATALNPVSSPLNTSQGTGIVWVLSKWIYSIDWTAVWRWNDGTEGTTGNNTQTPAG